MRRIEDLQTIMEDELLCYRTLLELKKKEQGLLLVGAINDLAQNTQNTELLIRQIQSLERTRLSLMNELTVELKLSEPPKTLKKLLEVLPEDLGENLKETGEGLEEVLGEVKKWNSHNYSCMEQALDYITNTFQTLMKLASESGEYSVPGSTKVEKPVLTLAVDRTA